MSDVVELLREHKSHVSCDWAGRAMQEAEEAILELQERVNELEEQLQIARLSVSQEG